MNPFQPLLNWLSTAFTQLIQWLGSALGQFFGGLMDALQFISAWLLSFFVNAFEFSMVASITVLTVLVGWLPDMPAAPETGSVSFLDAANRYLPIGEAVALGGIWAALIGGVMLYKLAKFLRFAK